MNQGQIALERMRREQAEKKDAELRRVKEIRDTDKMLQSSPAAAAIPEKVAMRMGKRMLPFVGIPLFGSMGAFVAFWYFATYKNMEFQPGMVATTTIVILVSGLLVRTLSRVKQENMMGALRASTHIPNIAHYLAFFPIGHHILYCECFVGRRTRGNFLRRRRVSKKCW
jgi:hypothetical protein